jgi:hypothetical protein
MKLRTILAGTVLAAVAAPAAAWAQTPPVEGGTEVGGFAPSFLELILPASPAGFTTFPKAKTYQMAFDVQVTATDTPTLLTLADGDAVSGAKLGHLASGAKRLPLPLEARVGSAFQSLEAPVDPLLTRWNDAITRQKATVRLRQRVKGKATGTYRKVVLLTASTETP